MATQAQIEANRKNAQKSTGPKTEAGKARSRMNGLTHGFTAAQAVIDPIEEELFPAFADAITKDLNPRSAIELTLVDQVISCAWRLRRVLRIESEHLRAHYGQNGRTLGHNLFAQDRQPRLFGLSAHETRVQRALHRAIQDLAELRRMPKPEQAEPTLPVDWLKGGSDPVEVVDEERKWLYNLKEGHYALYVHGRSLEKIATELLDLVNDRDEMQDQLEDLQNAASSPESEREIQSLTHALWKNRKEMEAYLETIRCLRKEKISKTEPKSLFDFFEKTLLKALATHLPEHPPSEQDPQQEMEQNAEREGDGQEDALDEQPTRTTDELEPNAEAIARAASILNPQSSIIKPPEKPHSMPLESGPARPEAPKVRDILAQGETKVTTHRDEVEPWVGARDHTGQAHSGGKALRAEQNRTALALSPLAEGNAQIPPARSAQDTRHNTQDTSSDAQPTTHKTEDKTLSERQATALARVRKHQLRLHAARLLPNDSEKNKRLQECQRLLSC